MMFRLLVFCLSAAFLSAAELPKRLQQVGGYAGSKVKGRPEPPLPFIAEKVADQPEIQRMITFKFAPGSGDLIYVDQPPKTQGTRLMRYRKGGEPEQLLLVDGTATGLEFHPDFEKNGFLYLGHWGPLGAKRGERTCKVTRHTLKDGKLESPLIIIEWESNGHNGLGLAIGSDGMFYVTTGDGTSDSDTDLTGQDLTKLLAKVLRIDVEKPTKQRAYSVPPDNPFVGEPNIRPETFAYGFRNPWRACWDHRLKRLWVGNNGQDRLEQAYLVERGANYGWSVYEGSRIFYANRKLGPHPVSLPTVEHDHGESRSLTGGVVYTARKHKSLKNAYIYGDNTTGKIWAVLHDGENVVWNREIADTQIRITDFGVDPRTGDLLVSDYRLGNEGGLYRLVPNPTRDASGSFPRRLSETGLFSSTAKHEVVPQLLPFGVNVPEWADGAKIQRFLMMPAKEPYLRFATRRGWNLPDETIALQTLALGDTRIETRMMVKQDGEWAAYTYHWNDAQSDAELVGAKGEDIKVNGRNWHIPSRAECMICHSRAANFVLGLQTPQLNREFDYHGTSMNQLEAMNLLGLFTKPGAKKPTSTMRQTPDQLDALAGIADESADLDQRARSFLHARCAHCHVPAGGGNAQMDLRYFVAQDKMGVFNETPYHGDLGFGTDAKIIVPGRPEKSVMLNRCSRVGPGQMPPMGSQTPDPRGVGLLAEWILASRADLSWPPTTFDKPASRDLLLQPTETLRKDIAIAKTPPKVSFHYYNCQTYEPGPGVWSVWGDGLAVSNKYYSAVGDHSSPGGNAFVYEYDSTTQKLRKLLDLRSILKQPAGQYTPGKIHSRLDLGQDGWLYFSTHRGSTKIAFKPEAKYRGDWILRHHLASGKTEVVAHAPLPMQCLPASVTDPERLIFYAGTADGLNEAPPKFLAYDLQNRRVLFSHDAGPARAMIYSRSTGRLYFHDSKKGPKNLVRFDPRTPTKLTPTQAKVGLRAATMELPNSKIYTVDRDQLWEFDPRTETARELGPTAVGSKDYITSLDADMKTGRYLYYIPGSHGGAENDGSPLVQYDLKNNTRKVICFLHPYLHQRHGYTAMGSYAAAVSPDGSRVFATWNGNRAGPDPKRKRLRFDTCALTVVEIPLSERRP